MIRITDHISIDEREIEESFVRSSGPGGQNVNKLSTAVQLRFDVRGSPSLPNDVAVRAMRLAGKRLTKDGVLVIIAQNHRTQERNRADALARLVALIQEAAVRPIPRRATKPTKALSGGERARMIFCRLMLLKPNVLVFDEPTNHLDLESINALNIALQRYDGTVLLVTHDHDVIDEVATRIWHFQGGKVEDFKGPYEEYVAYAEQQAS